MQRPFESFHLDARKSRARVPGPGGVPFAELLRHGTMRVEFFAPRGTDTQTPHRQDELYVVVTGHGEFVNGPRRHAFGPGDVMFVPAGVVHRFENFSDDFSVWVVFYGADGGEIPDSD